MPVELPRHPGCTDCELHKQADHVGMATRPWDGGVTGKDKALLILGSHPGYAENAQGRPFVGETGNFTNELYVKAMHLDKHADVYLSNGVRCWPKQREHALPGMYTACRRHLNEDIRELYKHYKEVVVLLTGAKVIKAFGGGEGLSTFHQGHIETYGGGIEGHECPVFATHLAAVLLPRHDPSKLSSIHEHLLMVQEYLMTGTLRMELHPEPQHVGSDALDPPTGCPLVSSDVETYGAIESQTVFHPEKSLYVDGKKPDELVLITSLAWYDEGAMHSKTYRMWMHEDVTRLVAVFNTCGTLLGQNFSYDLMYLRRGEFPTPVWNRVAGEVADVLPTRRFNRVLAVWRPVIDLIVVNFLENDQRVERSLKPLSRIMRTGEYSETEINLKAGEKYAGRDDPALASYCEFDARCTLHNYTLLSERIRASNEPDSHRWTERSQAWYSDLLWLTLQWSEDGFRMDRKKLAWLQEDALENIEKLRAEALTMTTHAVINDHGRMKTFDQDFVIGGKGSEPGRVGMLGKALELADLWHDGRVKFTKMKGRLSTGKENLMLVLDNTPLDNLGARMARIMRDHDSFCTAVANYYKPLLTGRPTSKGHGKTKHTVLSNPQDLLRADGFAFPTFNIVPSPFPSSSEDEGTIGGTVTGRITVRGPALQKFSKPLKACIISRFEGGHIVWIDESQVELRTGTMVFHDPVMAEVLSDPTRSIHGETGAWAAGRPVDKTADYH
ncbi:hypothetical protein LCGC14_1330280, partial [marine sediment metagenome]